MGDVTGASHSVRAGPLTPARQPLTMALNRHAPRARMSPRPRWVAKSRLGVGTRASFQRQAPTAGCTAASPRHLPWPRAVITCSRGQPAPADVPHLTDARRLPGSHTGSQGALLTERASRRWHRGTALRQRVVKAHPPWGLPSPAQDGEGPRHCLLPARCHWRPFRDPICHRGWRPA